LDLLLGHGTDIESGKAVSICLPSVKLNIMDVGKKCEITDPSTPC